ncbi:MAG: hypothetical protein K0R46_2339 [Herbinix sp.]|jgi:hypothetical protein|nr:hypothetical protein [Herbinix sp.]
MSRLNQDKLSVEFRDGVTVTEPITFRRYTLTHSDLTAELFLTIGLRYAFDKINTMRDEVLGEWIKSHDGYLYHLYLNIDGQFDTESAQVRNYIFRRELPLALEAIRYGDRELFNTYPELDYSPIIVFFLSSIPQYNVIEDWGTMHLYKSLT